MRPLLGREQPEVVGMGPTMESPIGHVKGLAGKPVIQEWSVSGTLPRKLVTTSPGRFARIRCHWKDPSFHTTGQIIGLRQECLKQRPSATNSSKRFACRRNCPSHWM